MCQNSDGFEQLKIMECEHWRVELHSNQCYLGRCVVILKRHAEDLSEITDNERDELFTILKSLKAALGSAFKPNLLNYSSLGNELRHVHVHVIPRYEKPVVFAGKTFTDDRWGKNPSPYSKDFAIPTKTIEAIASIVRSKLNS